MASTDLLFIRHSPQLLSFMRFIILFVDCLVSQQNEISPPNIIHQLLGLLMRADRFSPVLKVFHRKQLMRKKSKKNFGYHRSLLSIIQQGSATHDDGRNSSRAQINNFPCRNVKKFK